MISRPSSCEEYRRSTASTSGRRADADRDRDRAAALDLRASRNGRACRWTTSSAQPEFRRWTTPVKKGEYTIKVPQGTADRVRDGWRRRPGQLNAMQFTP
jgi:hypothetical protein